MTIRPGFFLLGVLVIFNLSGCVPGNVKRLMQSPPQGIAGSCVISQVPFYAQNDAYCGPAALSMVLNFYGENTRQEDIAKLVYLPELKGSLQAEMQATARQHDYLAYTLPPTLEALVTEVAAKHPVVVLQNLSLSAMPRWHYAVVIGYDLPAGELILHSGHISNYRMPLKTFEYTWNRAKHWGLVVLPAGELPAQDDPRGYFKAVVDFERKAAAAGKFDKTIISYQSAIARWPQQTEYALALANLHYKANQLQQAREVLQNAITNNLQAAQLYNNLAYILLAQGHAALALEQINQAVALAPDNQTYQHSFEEITAIINSQKNTSAADQL